MTDQNRISCKCRLNSYLDYLLSLGGQWHTNPLLIATVADLCNSSYAGKELLEKILVVSCSFCLQIFAGNKLLEKFLVVSCSCHCPPSLSFKYLLAITCLRRYWRKIGFPLLYWVSRLDTGTAQFLELRTRPIHSHSKFKTNPKRPGAFPL